MVQVASSFSDLLVEDNGAVSVSVAIEGDPLLAQHLSLAGLTGAGAAVSWFDTRNSWMIGSDQDDVITNAGGGSNVVRSAAGDDTVTTGDGNDRVYGGWGDDSLSTGAGDDVIAGERGNDEIDGGAGYDKLLLAGNRADYVLSIVGGVYRLSHLGGAGSDGIDTFTNIENLQFADEDVLLVPETTLLAASVDDMSRTLTVSGYVAWASAGRTFINVSGNSLRVEVTYPDGQKQVYSAIYNDQALPQHLNLADLTGVGGYVSWFDTRDKWIIGSNQEDIIGIAGGGSNVVRSAAGNDIVTTGDGNDRVYGGWGDDNLSTGAGDDLITGERGNDEIDGGAGFDTLLLVGNQDDYDLSVVDGAYQLSHLGGAGSDGVDTFANIERLEFADGSFLVDLGTQLTAVLDEPTRTLFVSGDAARDGDVARIQISYSITVLSIEDNGEVAISVPVEGYESLPNRFNLSGLNLSGLTGAGASVSWYSANKGWLFGSNQSDYLRVVGRAVVHSAAGDDYVVTGDGNDRVYGGWGDDNLRTGAGDDLIAGERGNDEITGGSGFDTLLLVGNRADYDLSIVDGAYQLSHLGGAGADGVDTFRSVEALQFADVLVALNSDKTQLSASVDSASRFLTISGDAALSENAPQVDVYKSGSGYVSIQDNGVDKISVPVEGDRQFAQHLNLSGMTGSGARITFHDTRDNWVIGSNQDDDISVYGGDLVVVRSAAGDDIVSTGNNSDDRVYGGWGDDILNTGGGTDLIAGERGNDSINGGAGFDTLLLMGNRADYDLSNAGGVYQLSHHGGAGADGIDTFINIEALQFADQMVALGDWIV
ncbi:calcium-binding protein [Aurantimonas sp. 22II-16-19i]|uniref:calcium-binding protein n=1 Tax=Aurantimonas sp. 22II-16-19i TaxID=1317114 RepID=UPI0009F7F74F|nr:calcium-binding protein [Aurantimonas sp. 22II-16-19i]ORE91453.1 hemolysin-type calcium-binding region [Aurantimonas sp. 22II-16-19i]